MGRPFFLCVLFFIYKIFFTGEHLSFLCDRQQFLPDLQCGPQQVRDSGQLQRRGDGHLRPQRRLPEVPLGVTVAPDQHLAQAVRGRVQH